MAKKAKELVPPMAVSIPLPQIKPDAQKEKLAKQFVAWLSSIEGTPDMPPNALLHLTFSCDVQPIDDQSQRPVPASAQVRAQQARANLSNQDPWICQKCNSSNTQKAGVCHLCSSPRPRVAPSEVATTLSKMVLELPPGFPPKPDHVDKFEGDVSLDEGREAYKDFQRKKARYELWENSLVAYKLRLGEGNREAAEKVVKELRKSFDLPETWDNESKNSDRPRSKHDSDRPRSKHDSDRPRSGAKQDSKKSDFGSLKINSDSAGMDASDLIAMKLLAQFEEMGLTSTPAKETPLPQSNLSEIDLSLDSVSEVEIPISSPQVEIDDPEDVPQTADDIARRLLAILDATETPRPDIAETPRLNLNIPANLTVNTIPPENISPKKVKESPEFKIPKINNLRNEARGSLIRTKSPRDFGPLLDNDLLTQRSKKPSRIVGTDQSRADRHISFIKSPREKSFRNIGPLLDADDVENFDDLEVLDVVEDVDVVQEEGKGDAHVDSLFSFELEAADYKATAQHVLASLAELLVDDDAEREKSEKLLELFENIENKVELLKAQGDPAVFSAPLVAKLGKEIRELLASLPSLLGDIADEKPFVTSTNVLLASLLRYIKNAQTSGEYQDQDILAKSIASYVAARDATHQAILNTGDWRKRDIERTAAHKILEECSSTERALAVTARIKQHLTNLQAAATAPTSTFNATEVVKIAKYVKEELTVLPRYSSGAPEEIEFSKVTQLLTAALLRLSKSKHSDKTAGEDERKVSRIRADFDIVHSAYEKFLVGKKSPERIEAEKILEEAARKDKTEKLKKIALSNPLLQKSKLSSSLPLSTATTVSSISKPKPLKIITTSAGKGNSANPTNTPSNNTSTITSSSSKTSIPQVSKSKTNLPTIEPIKNDNNSDDGIPSPTEQVSSGRLDPDTVKTRGRSTSAPQTPRDRAISTPTLSAIESQVAMLLNADQASEALDVEIAEANFEDVSVRLSKLEDLFSLLNSDSEDEGEEGKSEKKGKVSVMELFGPMSPLPERSTEIEDYFNDYDENDPTSQQVDSQSQGRAWPPRKKNTQYQPRNEARLKRNSQELRNRQLRHLARPARNSGSDITTSNSVGSLPSVSSNFPRSDSDLPEGFPPPPVVNLELAKVAGLALGDPQATITRKNREQYKDYMRQKLLYEQWENGLILYKKRLEEGNVAACTLIVKRLTELTDCDNTSSGANNSNSGSGNNSLSSSSANLPTSSSEHRIDSFSDTFEDKKKKKKSGREKEKRKSAKNVKMLSGTAAIVQRGRASSSQEVPPFMAGESKDKKKKTVVTHSRDSRETERRTTIDIVGYHREASPSPSSPTHTPSTISPESPTELHFSSGVFPQNSPGNNNIGSFTPEEKRSMYKRTKSQDALGRLSRVFKIET